MLQSTKSNLNIFIKDVTKSYISKKKTTIALDNLTIKVDSCGLFFIVGKSGSGKSTLLHLLAQYENCTSGEIYIADKLLNAKMKNYISFVFQDHNLINFLTVSENLSMISTNKDISTILKDVGLDSTFLHRKINTLSGGERQRIAIARTLLSDAQILLLDEPTGNLDDENANIVFEILKRLSSDKIILCVTHNELLAKRYGDKLFKLRKGKCVEEQNLLELKVNSININKDFLTIQNFIANSKLNNIQFCNVSENKNYIINKNISIESLYDLLKENQGNDLNFVYKKNTICNIGEFVDQKNTFRGKTKFKFFLNIITSKIFRFSLQIILLLLAFSLLFLQLNLSNNSEEELLTEAISSSHINNIPISKAYKNINIDETHIYNFGEQLFNKSSLLFGSANLNLLNKDVEIYVGEKLINVNVNITNDNFNQNQFDFTGKFPSNNNEIFISDYLSLIMFSSTNTIGNKISINDHTYKISGVYKTNFKDVIGSSMLTEKLKEKYEDYLNYNLNVVYITKDSYLENEIGTSIQLDGGNFLKSDKPTLKYVKDKLIYSKYSNENLVRGVLPKNNNELLISEDLANVLTNDLDEFDFSKIYNFKDLKKSIHFNSLMEIVNVFELFPNGVKIVGIYEVDSDYSDVKLNEEMWNNLLNKYIYYTIDEISVSFNNVDEFVKLAMSNDFIIDGRSGSISNEINSFFNGSFSKILLFLTIAFSTFAIISLTTNIISGIEDKKKEIAIIKSLNISSLNLISSYTIFYFIQVFFTIILSFIIGDILIKVFNKIITNPDVLNINFSIISISFLSYIVIILISFILLLLSIILPILKLKTLTIIQLINKN